MKKAKKLLVTAFILVIFISCTSAKGAVEAENKTVKNKVAENSFGFSEIWAYVLDGREKALTNDIPITDVGYFAAEINNQGFLTGVPDSTKLSFYDGRIHLVAVINHRGITHMMLNPEYPFREQLISDLISAVVDYNYDGLQIDYELVLASDKENFISFLEELDYRLEQLPSTEKVESRIFSVAIPARTRYLTEDAYDYEQIAKIVDSVFVMAYDEHWSGGEPGPVASFDWGQNVAKYSLETIGKEKLVMGQPFYGRTWGDINGNRAFFHSGMTRQIEENEIQNVERTNNILHFTYTTPITITGYFDDAQSIQERSMMYKEMGIDKTGFWCLGQEDPAVWDILTKKEN